MTTFTDAMPHPSHEDGPYRFERRSLDRWASSGATTAFCLTGDAFGRMLDLTLQDYSHDGMAAHSREPIMPGTEVSVGFSAPGYLAKRGTVLRCEPCGDGYRVGIQFQARMAACAGSAGVSPAHCSSSVAAVMGRNAVRARRPHSPFLRQPVHFMRANREALCMPSCTGVCSCPM